jgi:ATP-dependent RNA helicase DDX46/PRP5
VPATKPTAQLNRAALSGLGLKGLPLKPEFAKAAKVTAAAAMDDVVETKRKLEMLGDMPAVDMTMAEGEASVGDLEVDDDDEEANRMDQALKTKEKDAMYSDDDDLDPLDAFMTEIKEEVTKVNLEDMKKIVGAPGGRSRIRLDERMVEDGMEDTNAQVVVDELDATDLNPEDILALAAKKAKKKELATVDHSRVKYESFRKEFYAPPPDVAAMTDEEADLLRLELDSIKIRGLDCPRPVTKWSHYGLPANWYVPYSFSSCCLPCSRQSGCYQTTQLHSADLYSSSSYSCDYVWSRCHWCSEDWIWQDYCLSTATLPSHQGPTAVGANGGAYSHCHDSDS